MKNNTKIRQRKPLNKPVEFIERLELLNLLPESLDEFLQEFSVNAERFHNQQKTLKKYQAENSKRTQAGKEPIRPSPEKLSKILYPYETELKQLYSEFFKTLPDGLKIYLESREKNWRVGEQLLNMLAVERESLELIIYQQRMVKEVKRDFADWKSAQETKLNDEELYKEFCFLMKCGHPTIAKYNAKKYETHIPGLGIITLLPHIDQRLFYHRVVAGIERKGFTGFFTQLMAKDGNLDFWAQGIIGIIIRQKLTGSAPIEIDRLRRCEFCVNNLVYSYKDNQRYCSPRCRSAASAQRNRNDVLSLHQKKLTKAKKRLEMLKKRLDSNNDLIKEQEQKIEEIHNQINEEKKKNGNL